MKSMSNHVGVTSRLSAQTHR